MQCKEEMLLDIVKRRYDAELQRTKDLDTKAGNLIGYVSIVTGLIVGLGTFSILEKLSSPQYYVPYIVGVAALLLSIIASLFALRVISWEFSGKIKQIEHYYNDVKRTNESIALVTFHSMIQAIVRNAEKNESKANKIMISWISLVIGISLLAIFASIFALTGGNTTSNNTLTKILVQDAIKAINNKDTKDALSHLTLADKQIPAVGGNSTSRLFIEGAILALKNNDTKQALTSLNLISNP
jgi:hypothetical protein